MEIAIDQSCELDRDGSFGEGGLLTPLDLIIMSCIFLKISFVSRSYIIKELSFQLNSLIQKCHYFLSSYVPIVLGRWKIRNMPINWKKNLFRIFRNAMGTQILNALRFWLVKCGLDHFITEQTKWFLNCHLVHRCNGWNDGVEWEH